MNNLSNEERETHLNLVANNRGEWEVFSDDPVMVRKLDKIANGVVVGGGKRYTLDAGQVSLRKKRKPMSAKQRAVAAQRLAEALGRE